MVLYRKYRPQKFSDVVNQEHIVSILLNELKAEKIAHAYLFAGPKGTSKTTIARLLAKAVNCKNLKKGEPCNKCSSCKSINNGQALDLIEIDAASHRGIDEIRQLREGIKFTPTQLKYKVFIIDEVHQLTPAAFNALLKTLEEPPEHAIFILATTEPHKIIPTIISRCQRFDFHKISLEHTFKLLKKISKKEKVDIADKALKLIALTAQGDLRDAISLLDKIISIEDKKITLKETQAILGTSDIENISHLVDLLVTQKTKKALGFINKLAQDGLDMHQYAQSLLDYWRKLTILKIDNNLARLTAPELTKEQIRDMLKQGKNLNQKQLINILEILLQAHLRMKNSPLVELPLEMAIVEISLLIEKKE